VKVLLKRASTTETGKNKKETTVHITAFTINPKFFIEELKKGFAILLIRLGIDVHETILNVRGPS
jgi:hypothetical protein